MSKLKTIDSKDLDLFLFTDSIEDATEHIKNSISKFDLKKEKRFKPSKWLGEKE